ncbi:DNA-binding GntR family transcriptional regulator [Leifsonia sp. AK011]|uniref:GntR family transcriptional regulator n=1 Tax=Leifsonia sp. AK011 TaxID=2723075 RepID=UPI0015CD98CF|nr:GntR family transcriptional regulator [Leifsonia sp. AK011]NYF09405.1 DNA-binding GntR family transcriptional regulator [Leifsonia sp. AK011]
MSTIDPRISSSPVVTQVFEQLLSEMMSGELLPGQRISDADLAVRFGVSRTPVREALQKLRDIGLIEASASRFTRVTDVTPEQTDQAFTVWKALYPLLLEDAIPVVDADTVALLEADHAEYLEALPTLVGQRIATANFLFFSRLNAFTSNAILLRSLVAVVHIVRIGSLYLPRHIDFTSLARAQSLIIDAARQHDPAKAREAMEQLRGIEVPLS